MNIVLDIRHPAHINFFKNAIRELKKNGNNIFIIGINRGKVPEILKKEFDEYEIKILGSHRGNKFSIIIEANLIRFFLLFKFLIGKQVTIGLSVGSFLLGFVLKLLRKPNIQFDDDPESSQNFLLEKLTATRIFCPSFVIKLTNVEKFKALKEWAYLSPTYFKPNDNILLQYNIEKGSYIFIREVSNGSLNYSKQSNLLILSFANELPKEYNVLFSLEDKTKLHLYPDNWILLKEPLEDIHSLIYYSRMLISSGDSMARESAMLGVPSIYCGIREMRANDVLINKKYLYKVGINDVLNSIEKILINKFNLIDRELIRDSLNNEWEDVTQFIVQAITKYGIKKI